MFKHLFQAVVPVDSWGRATVRQSLFFAGGAASDRDAKRCAARNAGLPGGGSVSGLQ
jgi:hypothetical protein